MAQADTGHTTAPKETEDTRDLLFAGEDDVCTVYDYALIIDHLLINRTGPVSADLANAIARLASEVLAISQRNKQRYYQAFQTNISSH